VALLVDHALYCLVIWYWLTADVERVGWNSTRAEPSGWSLSSALRHRAALTQFGFDMPWSIHANVVRPVFRWLRKLDKKLHERTSCRSRALGFSGDLGCRYSGYLSDPKQTVEQRLGQSRETCDFSAESGETRDSAVTELLCFSLPSPELFFDFLTTA